MIKQQLITFEERVAEAFAAKQVKGPIHLSGGNEEQLIELFKEINREDYVFCSYRQHYHALLHGIPEEKLFAAILAGHSMTLQFPQYRFFSTAIMGGQLPIAVGVATALKRQGSRCRVWAFCGDMAASVGAFHEAEQYANGHRLPLTFVIEDNRLSCDSPTNLCWTDVRDFDSSRIIHYEYERRWPHAGIPQWVNF